MAQLAVYISEGTAAGDRLDCGCADQEVQLEAVTGDAHLANV